MPNTPPTIESIEAIEILDSRGYPTISCRVNLKGGASGKANVPSGASTGSYEACELRDQNKQRYAGKGVLQAKKHIRESLAGALCGKVGLSQQQLDQAMCTLDGSSNKSNYGANAILAVSMAYARALASDSQKPFYQWLGNDNVVIPVPLMNVINGGRHAHNQLAIQEFMIVPHGFSTFAAALRAGAEVTHVLGQNFRCGKRGDEGGFAPDFRDPRQVLDCLVDAIKQAGYTTEQIGLALDMASSEFYTEGKYFVDKAGQDKRTPEKWVDFIHAMCRDYPIVSIEDPAHESDWHCWHEITKAVGDRVQIVGDDLFVTQLERLKQGVATNSANAILIKPNQVGTLSEVQETLQYAKKSGYNAIISHRSGETEDTMIADLAVGLAIGQIKTGPTRQSDRVAKYNRLLWIEHELGHTARFAGSQAFFSMEKNPC